MRKANKALRSFCIALILTRCTPAWALSVSDWVHQAASQKLPTYPADTNAVVLLAEEDDTVTSPSDWPAGMQIEQLGLQLELLRQWGRRDARAAARLK